MTGLLSVIPSDFEQAENRNKVTRRAYKETRNHQTEITDLMDGYCFTQMALSHFSDRPGRRSSVNQS